MARRTAKKTPGDAETTLRTVLAELYAGIDDEDVRVRRKAVTAICRELAKERLRDKVFWMRDPRAVDPLLVAAGDPDAMVAKRALLSLSRIVSKYYRDPRTLSVALPRLAHEDAETRRLAISIVGCLRDEAALEHLVPIFERGADEDRAWVAGQIGGLFEPWDVQQDRPNQWTEAALGAWKARMLRALSDASVAVRKEAARALKNLGHGDVIGALEAARRTEQDENVAYELEHAVKTLNELWIAPTEVECAIDGAEHVTSLTVRWSAEPGAHFTLSRGSGDERVIAELSDASAAFRPKTLSAKIHDQGQVTTFEFSLSDEESFARDRPLTRVFVMMPTDARSQAVRATVDALKIES